MLGVSRSVWLTIYGRTSGGAVTCLKGSIELSSRRCGKGSTSSSVEADQDYSWTTTRLLLTGVVVAAGWGAVIALLLTLAPDAQVKGMLFWLIGDLGGTTVASPALVTLAIALAASLAFARDLNVLSRGEETAAALGVAVGRTTAMLCAVAALATAAAVTTAGSVGFVGLVVPHGLRLVVGNDQRLLLPASVLCGGTLLVFADTLARTIAAPIQLPVGVITALVGVPVLLLLLTRIRS